MKTFSLKALICLSFICICSSVSFAQSLSDKIVFTRQQSGNDWDLYLMNRDGSSQQKLIDNSYRDTNPYFNLSGSKIVFGRITSTMPMAADVYIVNSNGSGELNLTSGSTLTGPALSPKFSPDGSKVVFDIQNTPGNTDIYIINTDGTGLTGLLTDSNDDSSPHYSPDGQWVVFQRLISTNPNPKSKLCKVKISDGTVVELTRGNDLDEMPCWSPDGNYIIFKRGANNCNICRIPYNHDPASDTDITNLTNTTNSVNDAPRYSLEGDKIGYMSTHGYNTLDSMEIYVMNADGTSPQRLTYNKVADFDPAFTPKSTSTGLYSPFGNSQILLKNTPNPCYGFTTIQYNLSETTSVQVLIYDLKGKLLIYRNEGIKESGEHSIILNISDLPRGMYVCKLTSDDNKAYYKMIVL